MHCKPYSVRPILCHITCICTHTFACPFTFTSVSMVVGSGKEKDRFPMVKYPRPVTDILPSQALCRFPSLN